MTGSGDHTKVPGDFTLRAALAGPVAVGFATWGHEFVRLGESELSVGLFARASVTAWAGLLVVGVGTGVAIALAWLRTSNWFRTLVQLPAWWWVAGVVAFSSSSFGTYALVVAADRWLAASGTRSLFLAWGVGTMVLTLIGTLVLAWRLRGRLAKPLSEPALVGLIMVAFLTPLALFFFEREVFVGIEGPVLQLPVLSGVVAIASGYALSRFTMPLTMALVGAALIAGVAVAAPLAHEPSVDNAVEQHTRLTRKLFEVYGSLRTDDVPVLAVGGASCWPGQLPRVPSVSEAAEGAPDILLVTVDGMRWDHTTMGGYERDTTPQLAKAANQAALFTKAYTNSASTRQTFRSLLSGVLPSQVAPSRGKSKWTLSFPEGQLTLADYMRAAGYATIAIQTNPVFLDEQSRALTGFDVKDFTPAEAWLKNGYSADYHVDRVIAHLSDFTAKKPRFIFTHLMEPHQPFRKGPGARFYGKRRVDKYDASLSYIDRQLRRLVDFAHSPERRDRTFLIITSDHGMSVGDRDNLPQHGSSVFDDQVRVPLAIFGPRVRPRKIDETVSLHDVFPTIVDFAGLEPMSHVCGKSLLPVVRGESALERDPALIEIVPDHANDTFKMAMIDGPYKFVVDVHRDRRALFDLSQDPEELRDLTATEPDRLRELEAKLATLLAARGRDPRQYNLRF